MPGKIIKDVKNLKRIDKEKLYRTLGHSFYTKYLQNPSYVRPPWASRLRPWRPTPTLRGWRRWRTRNAT